MRKIKFRAWDKVKEIMYSNVHFDNDKYFPRQLKASEIDCLEFVKYTDCNIMQYTGLLDKRGVKIYEGDMVKAKLQIKQEDYSFTGSIIFENCKFTSENADFELWIYEELEVIGNIYENPELLKI